MSESLNQLKSNEKPATATPEFVEKRPSYLKMILNYCRYTTIRNEYFLRDEFDKSRGTETCRDVSRWRLGTDNTSSRYAASSPEVFTQACQFLPPEAKTYSFLDLGCGKGRALILAQEYGFQRIVGVELSPKLLKICRQNLSKLRIRNVSLIEGNAATITLPECPVVVFMYNPFRPPTFTTVIERLAKHRYPLFLLYDTPFYRKVIEQAGCFTVISDSPGLFVCVKSD